MGTQIALPQPPIQEIKIEISYSLPDVIQKMFMNPLRGLKRLLSTAEGPFRLGLLLSLMSWGMVSLGLLSLYFFYGAQFWNPQLLFQLSIFPLFVVGMVTLLMFCIKKIVGRADVCLSEELLTGGIYGLYWSIFLVAIFLSLLFIDWSMIAPEEILGGATWGIAELWAISDQFRFIIPMSLAIVMLSINLLQQSLLVGEVRSSFAFYLAPGICGLVFYAFFKWMFIIL